MQGMVPLSGFGGVPYSAVRKAAPRNILDNSDFTNLVAQAGIGGNHGTIAYAADRWILDSGTVSYEAGVGLTLNGTIRQKLEFPPTGATSTFVGMASGAASISYADGAVTITSSGGVLKWAALYGGVYSTATMPDYQPKGYGAELVECQRYYVKLNHTSGTGNIGIGFAPNTSAAYINFELPVSMRTAPSIVCTCGLYNRTSLKTISHNDVSIHKYYGFSVLIKFTASVTAGNVYSMTITSSQKLEFISDL